MLIFGASGDLTSRHLIPALIDMERRGALPDGFKIVGVDVRNWDTGQFQRHLADRLDVDLEGKGREMLASRVEYRQADVTNQTQMSELLKTLGGPFIAYMALPPGLFRPTAESLAGIELPEGSRIVVEKPFGKDQASARDLNELLHRSFAEDVVFRIDHFLHKQTVQNVLGVRFANRIFESVWNSHHIERVEIVWDESRTLEGRKGYDTTGALRDMIQNHLLELLALVGMEPPPSLDQRSLRDHKLGLLRAVVTLSDEEIAERTVRARYSRGEVGGRAVPAYAAEEWVDPARQTETFAQVTLHIDNWRWAGVPIVLRSGKALARERREINIHFKPVPHLAFCQHKDPIPNVLTLSSDPDRLSLTININGPGNPLELEPVTLAAELAPQAAYSRLLEDILDGDVTFTIRDDEAEELWRITEPIVQAWQAGKVPLHEYAAGSNGPV